jgi:hypothetical protein
MKNLLPPIRTRAEKKALSQPEERFFDSIALATFPA